MTDKEFTELKSSLLETNFHREKLVFENDVSGSRFCHKITTMTLSLLLEAHYHLEWPKEDSCVLIHPFIASSLYTEIQESFAMKRVFRVVFESIAGIRVVRTDKYYLDNGCYETYLVALLKESDCVAKIITREH